MLYLDFMKVVRWSVALRLSGQYMQDLDEARRLTLKSVETVLPDRPPA